jgi:hypothetical protein
VRRTNASLIYRRTENLRSVRLAVIAVRLATPEWRRGLASCDAAMCKWGQQRRLTPPAICLLPLGADIPSNGLSAAWCHDRTSCTAETTCFGWPFSVFPGGAAASHAKISRRRLDELIEKRCNHYRQMMGCTPSGPRRVRPVIVSRSTHLLPNSSPSILVSDGCSLADGSGQVGRRNLGRSAYSRTCVCLGS